MDILDPLKKVATALAITQVVEMDITPHPKTNTTEVVTQTRGRGIGTAALVANITNPQRSTEDKNLLLQIVLVEYKFQNKNSVNNV